MKLYNREFIAGDEIKINSMYQRITGINRNKEKYEWEWINTWNGQGGIYLLFDEERSETDNLVAQYSMIPVPMSVFGKLFLGGKTENCMSHPDYRSKKIYFPHEKKCFEFAKKRFDIFYTTAGSVSNWSVAAIREKLGYISFDNWSENLFSLNSKNLSNFLCFHLNIKNNKSGFVFKIIHLATRFFVMYSGIFSQIRGKQSKYEVEVKNEDLVDLNEIDELWKKNKQKYGISIDRSYSFLKWRLVDNPHFDHIFVQLRKNSILVGNLVCNIDSLNILNIVDIFADEKNKSVFNNLIANCVNLAKNKKAGGILCRTLEGNSILRAILRKNGFFDLAALDLKQRFRKYKRFLIYLPESLKSDPSVLNRKNWYCTSLFTEGRDY